MKLFKVIDYQKAEADYSNENFDIIPGYIDVMKHTTLEVGNEDGFTKIIAEDFLKGRYNGIIHISKPDERKSYIKDDPLYMQLIIEEILDLYTENYLIITTIPAQLYKYVNTLEPDSTRAIFEKKGFKDLRGRLDDNIRVAEYIMIYMNDLGTNAFVDTMNEFW